VTYRPVARQNLETDNETTAVAMKRRCKHASTTIELLLEMMFSAWSIPRSYLENNWRGPFNCQLLVESQSVKRRLEGWCEMAASMGVVS
jgi:hypothetical protein